MSEYLGQNVVAVAKPSDLGRRCAVVEPSPRHPISQWYLVPLAKCIANWLAPTHVRPVHLTMVGLVTAIVAATVLCIWPFAAAWAAPLVLVSWFFDRADGLLARRQGTASAWGAWLDANVDELVDVGLQVAVATAAVRLTGSQLPWLLLTAFLAGKYLFFQSVAFEETENSGWLGHSAAVAQDHAENRFLTGEAWFAGLMRRCYHLPGNADIRIHLLLVALMTGCLTAELALVAAYYNMRWIVRYALVARRLGGSP